MLIRVVGREKGRRTAGSHQIGAGKEADSRQVRKQIPNLFTAAGRANNQERAFISNHVEPHPQTANKRAQGLRLQGHIDLRGGQKHSGCEIGQLDFNP